MFFNRFSRPDGRPHTDSFVQIQQTHKMEQGQIIFFAYFIISTNASFFFAHFLSVYNKMLKRFHIGRSVQKHNKTKVTSAKFEVCKPFGRIYNPSISIRK